MRGLLVYEVMSLFVYIRTVAKGGAPEHICDPYFQARSRLKMLMVNAQIEKALLFGRNLEANFQIHDDEYSLTIIRAPGQIRAAGS